MCLNAGNRFVLCDTYEPESMSKPVFMHSFYGYKQASGNILNPLLERPSRSSRVRIEDLWLGEWDQIVGGFCLIFLEISCFLHAFNQHTIFYYA
ncbi:MAG: hypothetical protein CMI18_07555 [Opitutaceae bacterium]|nr:hypothetical protein [Opitutaceae bacterium]